MHSTTGDTGTRLIHLDAVGGVAGDMFVAALLDAFPELTDRVMADVAAVLPDGCGTAQLEPGFSAGIRCLRFGLRPSDAPHSHGHADHHSHGARFADLRRRISGAGLSPGTAAQGVSILTHLAEAEAHIHGVALEDVHFHEVGDWDSLMDVVAAGSIAAALAPAIWTVSDLPLGSGLVRTQHGLLPVPAPATTEILKGFSWRDDKIAGERVTPTGAAILRALCDPANVRQGPAKLTGNGTGAGTRTLPGMPNILRATVFEQDLNGGDEAVDIITFDIDDMTGEEIAVAADHIRSAPGVIDVTLQTLTGKKGRSAYGFQILATPGSRDVLAPLIFRETSTLGLRWRTETRVTLPRAVGDRAGLRIKTATRPDGIQTTKAESDDLASIAGLSHRRTAAQAAEAPTRDHKHE
ncbi:LarC family nickel insertion protein [Roseicitreum antarcticum]|uniref:LarC family nickel insertion protein n=1 Tax=Roseicitreum antarcticum TaxID=564137 RepID=A0A1H2YKH3_9RHOB|nr:LarC family nickel insertion protein [Roseicitreum antarcticum]SDX05580.1 hypothetical protein SAMN04488238_10538 [Roseicitreum antarcticum]